MTFFALLPRERFSAATIAFLAIALLVCSFSRADAFTDEIARFEKVESAKALELLDKFDGWSPQRQAAFLIGTRMLTRGDSLGAYRLYFHANGCITRQMMPHIVKGLELEEPSARLYTLRMLNICKPMGIERKLFEMAVSDKDEDTALEAIRLLGAIGIPQQLVITNSAKLRKLKHSRLESFVLQYSASPKANSKAVAAISGTLPPTPTLAGALAQAGDAKAFEMAGGLVKASDLAQPWLWRILVDLDPAKACDLFNKRIADVLEEEGQADLIDALFETAGTTEPAKCMAIAETYKRRGFDDAYMRALSWTAHPQALEKLREKVYEPERSTDVLQRVRYLVECGDYSAVGKIKELLKKDEVKGIPRRASWAASMLTYFSDDSGTEIVHKAFEGAAQFTSKCHGLPQLARVSPKEAASAMDEMVPKWIEQWEAEWKKKPDTSYNSTALPELYYAMLSLTSAAAELPPAATDKYASLLLEAAGPYFASDVLSAYGWHPADPTALSALKGHLASQNLMLATASANVLAFTGGLEEYASMMKLMKGSSLELARACAGSCLSLRGLEIPSSPATYYIANATLTLQAQANVLSEPEQTGTRLLKGQTIAGDTETMETAAKATSDATCDAQRLLIMRALRKELGYSFVKLPDYHEKFSRHAAATTLKAFLAAQSTR